MTYFASSFAGIAPSSSRFYLDMSPVDYVAFGIVCVSLLPKTISSTKPVVFHCIHPRHLVSVEAIANAVSKYGYKVQHLPYNQWFTTILNSENAFAPLVSQFRFWTAPLTMNEIAMGKAGSGEGKVEKGAIRRPILRHENFDECLCHFDSSRGRVGCVDGDALERTLEYLISIGAAPPPLPQSKM
jgi:hypothetical protein